MYPVQYQRQAMQIQPKPCSNRSGAIASAFLGCTIITLSVYRKMCRLKKLLRRTESAAPDSDEKVATPGIESLAESVEAESLLGEDRLLVDVEAEVNWYRFWRRGKNWFKK
ncbi:hypothetical protein B0H11DRAFT_1901007 [Mycena galericulata]|nr:hypothetical protein B0H11DRAFT_1901007 [Mycena galericulata]